MPQSIKDDRDFCFEAVKIEPGLFTGMPQAIQDDRDFCFEALKIDLRVFALMPQSIKDDRDFCFEALKIDLRVFTWMPQAIQDDRDFCLEALKIDLLVFKWILPQAIQDDRDFCLEALKIDSGVFALMPQSIKDDRDFCLEALTINALLLTWLPEAIQNDVDFCADAVRRNHQLFHHFPEQLRTEPGFLQRVLDDAQQVLALVQCIHVSNNDVEDREKALMSLGRVAGVSPELIIPHISQIIACLGDPELRIRLTVPTVLASLGTHMSPHFPAIEALMHSASPGVKTAVEMTFEWLEHIPEAKAALDRVRRAMDAGGACAVHSAS